MGNLPLRLWAACPEQRQARLKAERINRTALRKECRRLVAKDLADRVLLAIRNGGWHPVHKLRDLVRTLAPAGLPERRFLASGGDRELSPAVQETQGCSLLLNDALALCCRRKLAELRRNEADEHEVRSTPRIDSRFEIRPGLRDLLPEPLEEAGQLDELLLADGCRDALLVGTWPGTAALVDGHRCFSFCSVLGRPYAVAYREFADEEAARAYRWQLHGSRSGFNELTKSYCRAKQYLDLRRTSGGDRRSAAARAQREGASKVYADGLLKMDAASVVARRCGVRRTTVFNDLSFYRAVERVVAACGVPVRRLILSERIKGTTKSYISRLSRLDAAMQQQLVQQAEAEGRWPPLPSATGQACVWLKLPLGKPRAQGRELLRKLGLRQTSRLAKVLPALVDRARQRTRQRKKGS